ncbi:hypothetical protein QA640_09280 [Bradyrhizobium sp. CB82]|uniref:hypothetical protein n=1 Tax=Bradyrhizobium sp. CB82 TaxID=3039159 RepID=UPI0024B0CFED|nr:hypothetical protein [Bradyrhizobium sp. CB82]WFU42626.1 hypothetical protein QA640_09280 [Bradyrhizobium sp. CB82]
MRDSDSGDNRIKLVNAKEAATADFVVCVLYLAEEGLLLPDNVLDRCWKCGRRVQLRPTVPTGPRRICIEDAILEVEAHGQDEH